MKVFGGKDLESLTYPLRKPWRYLPKEQSVSLTFPSGTPEGTEGFVEVTPPNGYVFAIRYFVLTTPEEVEGNILVTGMDGEETRLLAENQSPGLSDQTYDHSDWDTDFFYLKKFKLYGYVTTDTTADRVITLKWSGALVRVV